VSRCDAQQTKKSFTVADEIGLADFGGRVAADAVRFSPDGSHFAVWTERGRLDLNKVEDSLRFYRCQDVKKFFESSLEAQPLSPVWVVTLSTAKEGPIVSDWRWLPDSSGVAFLERTASGNKRLVLANLRTKRMEALTSASATIGLFDVRDRRHYVYTIADPAAEQERIQVEREAPATVGTGRSLYEVLFPDNPRAVSTFAPRSYLWAVVGGRAFQVKHDGGPLAPKGDFGNRTYLALSPDGRSLVTTLLVPAPLSWEILYAPPHARDSYRIHAGENAGALVGQYVRIDLQRGSIQALTNAPTSSGVGWFVGGGPSWSSDGHEILLPGTFLGSKEQMASRPCVAVVDLLSNIGSCVEMLENRTETDVKAGEIQHYMTNVKFIDGDKSRIMVSFFKPSDLSVGATEYHRSTEGTWKVAEESKGDPEVGRGGLAVNVKQGLNDPPRLVATYKQESRLIWDPNPQLRNIELGQARVYKWKDKEGRDRVGGLYKPSDYTPRRRYPLVIQTHGFPGELEFAPSGVYPTAFAARALAAAGMVVLQGGDDHCPMETPSEGPCAVSGYESGANQLVSEGVVDPEKIGIIGFSRSCFWVMEMLTMGSVHLKAASVTDGLMMTYSQYVLDEYALETNNLYDRVIGVAPFGEGLQQWLKRSPSFNLGKVTAPLLVAGEGPISFLGMWETYAVLRFLHKPVDLVMLNTDEHVLTNPAVRMASQGGSIDWFRFWLQDYEDPDPAKVGQYGRWRGLRKLQEENDAKDKAAKEKGAAPN